MKTRRSRALLALICAVVLTVAALHSINAARPNEVMGVIAIPALLAQLLYQLLVTHADMTRLTIGPVSYISGILIWFLVLWMVFGFVFRLYSRFQQIRKAAESEPPAET